MHTELEIWKCTEDRDRLWAADPERAARLAYLEVLAAWHDQVEAGQYLGVPAVHLLPENARKVPVPVQEPENVVVLRRPARQHTPDDAAREYRVPPEILRRVTAA